VSANHSRTSLGDDVGVVTRGRTSGCGVHPPHIRCRSTEAFDHILGTKASQNWGKDGSLERVRSALGQEPACVFAPENSLSDPFEKSFNKFGRQFSSQSPERYPDLTCQKHITPHRSPMDQIHGCSFATPMMAPAGTPTVVVHGEGSSHASTPESPDGPANLWPRGVDEMSPSGSTPGHVSSPTTGATPCVGLGETAPVGGRKVASNNTTIQEPIHLEQATMSPALSTGQWSRTGVSSQARESSGFDRACVGGNGNVSTNAKPEEGRLNQNSPVNKMDSRVSAEVGSPTRKVSTVNSGVASLRARGIQSSTHVRSPWQKCGRRQPTGVRAWPPPRSVAQRAKSPLAAFNSVGSSGIRNNWSSRTVNGACWEEVRVGKAIPVKWSDVGGSGSAVVSGSPMQRNVSGRNGVSRSAAVAPEQELRNTLPNQCFEAHQAIRQSSAPLWTHVPVMVAEVLVAGLATGKPHGPCVHRPFPCTVVNVNR